MNFMQESTYQRLVGLGWSVKDAYEHAMSGPKAPGVIGTDTQFLAGQGTLADQFNNDDATLKRYTDTAKRHGYTPNYTDVWDSSLAAYPGDPKGFIPASEGKGHVRRTCEQRGWSCEGEINVKSPMPDPGPDVRLAPGIVAGKYDEMVKENPRLKEKPRRDIEEAIIEEHGSLGD